MRWLRVRFLSPAPFQDTRAESDLTVNQGIVGSIPTPGAIAPSAGSAARTSNPGMPSSILGGGSKVSVVKLDITQVPETWIPDPNSGGGTVPSSNGRTLLSHGRNVEFKSPWDH
jgi:hypothetical protein